MEEKNNPVIFSITKEEEIRYYRNDDMNLNDLIKRYSECERPFIELGETTHSQRIGTMGFVELEQTLGTTSIEIVPDENRVTVYENKGNDVYENELGDGFEEYKLSELLQKLEKEPVESEKSTITVDENDILQMSDKIKMNNQEDKEFEKEFDKFLVSTEKSSDFLRIGLTPNALAISGANKDLDVVIAPRTIAKCMSEADEKYHGHAISYEIMKKLPQQLRNPVMVFKGSANNSLVVITDLKDKEQRGIMISLALDQKRRFSVVNRITSVYGRNNFKNYLQAQVDNNNTISYNKEKTDKLFKDIGHQLPKLNTAICFDNSIAYTINNVKTPNVDLNKEKANQVLHSNGLQLPPENTLNGSNNSITLSDGNVNMSGANIIETMQAEGKAEINDDGSFKVNNSYYRSLPREERVTEVVPARHAAEIMQQLSDKGIEFSAVSRQHDKAAITVHINNKDELRDSAKAAADKQIKKKQPEISKSENKERINPEYYKKLDPADRHIQRITKADTDKVLSSLESKGIEFSAVKSDKFTAITVHKVNKAAIGQALLESNKAAAKEYINSDYFKSLPADQRAYSQTADLKAAKDMMNSLDAADIKYSAVIDNERSTAKITIAKADIPQAQKSGALFSRQSQRAFTSKAQAQNSERTAVKTAERKKDEQSL